MKPKDKMRLLAALSMVLSVSMILTGCSFLNRDEKSTSERFDAYMEEIFLSDVVQDTITLHYTLAYPENYGITDYEVSLGSFSVEEIEESYKEMEETLKEILGFDREELTEEQRLTYDILVDYLEAELSVKDLILYSELLSPTTGYQSELPIILAEYTFRTEQDIKDYLALAAQMDDFFAELVSFEEKKSEAGLFMPDYAADAVIEQCEAFIEDPENNYMIEVFNDKIDAFEGLSSEEKQSYKDQNFEIITTDVVNAYRTLIEGLTKLKGTGTNELGLCYYENGTEYYEYLVRFLTGSDSSVEELQINTEKYIDDCIVNIQKAIINNPSLIDSIYDYSFPVTEPEEIMKDLISKVSSDFPEPPEVNYTIKYVHESMQEFLSPAFYLTTPIDDVKNNVIYINQKYLEPGSDYAADLYTVLAHEGYPGHLYQNVYTNSCELPLVRELLSYPGYSEGWATYVEYYSYSISGIDKDLADVLAWNSSSSLAIYAYIDMGINYSGWDREDTENYITTYFGVVDDEIIDEIFEIMVEEPGNYLSYFVGYMEFSSLRETAEDSLGDGFSAKDFHEFLLETGPAPFYIIEDYMYLWMEGLTENK